MWSGVGFTINDCNKATNGFESKVPTRVLMQITGHKKETTFLNYVQTKREVELSQILEIYPTQLRRVG